MKDRYLRRFTLPERLYTASSPVVLAAGALLEDTKTPRLVAQLKWKSVDSRPVASLTAAVRCPEADGKETVFTYSSLHVLRGQTFGTYTAVVLPWSQARTMEVRAVSAVFSDGTTWTAPEGAIWASLPPFVPLKEAVADEDLMPLSASLPHNRYACYQGQGLWYCPCGGVNRAEEDRCHRCGCRQDAAVQRATAAGLLALRLAQREQEAQAAAERQRREEAAKARHEALRQQISALQDRLHQKTPAEEEGQSPSEPAPARPEPSDEAAVPTEGETPSAPSAPAPQTRSRGRRRWKIVGAVCAAAVLVIAAIALLPRGGQEQTAAGSGGGETGASLVGPSSVSAPGDGETVPFYIEEDADGRCVVTAELAQEQIPGVEYINFSGVPDLGSDIDAYLTDSFQMAALIASGGEWGSEGERGYFRADSPPTRPRCLLLFDSNTHLMGHAIGVPYETEEGLWQMDLTLCDYDFTDLYEDQAAAFSAGWEEAFNHYISPEDLSSSGAAFFLSGYNTGRGPTLLPGDPQAYHLWTQWNSSNLDQFCSPMEELSEFLPDQGRYMAFLLLDEDHTLLGYTMLDSEGGGGQSTTSLSPTGTAELIVQENDQGQCEFTEALVRDVVPETSFFNFEGFAPDLGGDVEAYLTDSLHMAWLVSSGGTQRGGHSSAIWNLQSDRIFTLLLYKDFTTLCGYFVGAPENLGSGRWRIEITLCDYDFTDLYAQQADGYTAAAQLPQLSESDLSESGAAWYIEPVSQLSGNDAFSQQVRLQSLWSRATSPYLSQFCRPITDLPNTIRWASEEMPYTYLLLSDEMQYIGYVTVTHGEEAAEMLGG